MMEMRSLGISVVDPQIWDLLIEIPKEGADGVSTPQTSIDSMSVYE
jgi:hypothetical protein